MSDFNEPNIADYYNEQPHMVNVIDKMNGELSIVQQENKSLKARIKLLEDMDKQRNPVKILIEGKDIEKYRIAELTLEDDLNELLYEAKIDDGNNDVEIDMEYIFNHIQDYVEVLMRYSKQSKEWCMYRVYTCFREYISLKIINGYWMDSLLQGDTICNDIIERIRYYLIVGKNDECTPLMIMTTEYTPDIDIRNIYIVKCDICHNCLPYLDISTYNEGTKITECYKCSDDY